MTRSSVPALLTAFVCGAVSVQGFAPFHQFYLLFPALALFFWLLQSVSWRRGALLGWVFGLGHFGYGFIWLLTSLHDNGGIPLPVAWLMLLALAAFMGVYVALFGGLVSALAPRGALGLLALPSLWVLTEWLRAHLFTGFAWNLLGYVLSAEDTLRQAADLGGVYLLSWGVAFSAAALALVVRPLGLTRGSLSMLVLAALPMALFHGYGVWRVAELRATPVTEKPMTVGLVQGNIPQKLKWDNDFSIETMRIYHELSRTVPKPVDLLVWPETAVPFFLQNRPEEIEKLKALTREMDAALLTGVPTADEKRDGEWLYYNSMIILDPEVPRLLRYNKHHLVPYGEYVPMRWLLPSSFVKVTYGSKDFSPGPGAVALPWNGRAIGPLVCYEAVVAEQVRELALDGARWLVNVTNDGWFGPTAKPQHLAMVRLRSVETRLPMIRAANTGISAVFDQEGNELGRIEPDLRTLLRVTVPPGVGESFYLKTGPLFWNSLYGLICLLALLRRRHRQAALLDMG